MAFTNEESGHNYKTLIKFKPTRFNYEMNREEILPDIIEGYRNSILERYQYHNIQKKYNIPQTVNEKTVNNLRDYFLENLYPEFEKRQELEKAFRSLDEYIKKPQKLIGILFEASKLVFKYGRHLHLILNAGLKALKSFRAASKFESILIEEAIKNDIQAPYDLKKIDALIALLPRIEVEDFIETSQSLFETLHDKVLTNKIIEMIGDLINVMKTKEDVYSLTQVNGLKFGLKALKDGNALFNSLNHEDQVTLIELISEIERDRLNQIA
ncbi:hypothetical protein [Croceivirga thetidis]|uniref:Uncharacterized protein n=1 Tax=Croceivirga thetidis TaxID=2721623 RepID=A0ABX1GNZ6_9FLAO|nr:hypothetical protein [Croceivirga thetidis]NKI31643.1 hypothetical protein [Croceivirga thetidis]